MKNNRKQIYHMQSIMPLIFITSEHIHFNEKRMNKNKIGISKAKGRNVGKKKGL